MLKFKKTTYIPINTSNLTMQKAETQEMKEPFVPEGLWRKCDKCQETLYNEDVIQNNYVCQKCGHHFRLDAKTRMQMVTDKGSFIEWDSDIATNDPLHFEGYKEKLELLKKKTNVNEAVITGKTLIRGEVCAIGICDSSFLMGSMGYAVGEKITRLFERATEERLPVVLFTCSGGARMQEGIVSLMQMAKTSAAIKKHSDAGLFYLTVLTDPTTGGVTASFAMLGDIILAEPGALIGFAGPRVIEQTIGQKLPEGFQRAEFLLKHGLIDGILPREKCRKQIARLLRYHKNSQTPAPYITTSKKETEQEEFDLEESVMDAWERVKIARKADRPTALDYMRSLFTHFTELHGDRAFHDDSAIIGGIGYFDGYPVTVIGQQKGRNTKENIERNFGMPNPEGYRKALRLMKQAEKFNRPIITLIDTPGAFCGLEAEERGQGEAIARNLLEMATLTVPVLSIIIGEGGSGGALALAVGNEVWMMENAMYSILSPEGFASILWKDSKRAEEAARVMKITAYDLKKLDMIEKVIPEPSNFTIQSLPEIVLYMKQQLELFLTNYTPLSKEELVNRRYERFRRM